MGGFQPTFVPDECAAHADSLFIGDAETGWATVVEDARRGDLKPMYRASPGPAAARRPDAARHLRGQGLPAHQPPAVLARLPVRLRFLRGDAVLRQEALPAGDRRDDPGGRDPGPQARCSSWTTTSLSDRVALKAACRALIPMRVNWVSQASLDVTADREADGAADPRGVPRPHHGLRVDHPRERAGGEEVAEPAEVRQVRHPDPHPPRVRPADLGRVHPRLRSRHRRLRPRHSRLRPREPLHASPPSTS